MHTIFGMGWFAGLLQMSCCFSKKVHKPPFEYLRARLPHITHNAVGPGPVKPFGETQIDGAGHPQSHREQPCCESQQVLPRPMLQKKLHHAVAHIAVEHASLRLLNGGYSNCIGCATNRCLRNVLLQLWTPMTGRWKLQTGTVMSVAYERKVRM